MRTILAAALACVLSGAYGQAVLNSAPVVGILTLPNFEGVEPQMRSYFPASYVKFVESGGAMVVPVPFTLLQDNATAFYDLLGNLNGFLFTGGGADFSFPNNTLTPFAAAAEAIFSHVSSAWTQRGETIPLWGTCLGFELISFLASGPAYPGPVTCCFDSENYSIPLVPTAAATRSSRMWSAFLDSNVTQILTQEPVTFNAHSSGVTPSNFVAYKNLSSTFTVLSTNVDRNNVAFVSSMEGQNGLPIFATQWHPEKVAFEWDLPSIDHSADSVRANSVPSRILGTYARMNNRSFPSWAVLQSVLIYNYQPLYTDGYFEQSYFFN
jgi:gamma-glutamyl hydrolase